MRPFLGSRAFFGIIFCPQPFSCLCPALPPPKSHVHVWLLQLEQWCYCVRGDAALIGLDTCVGHTGRQLWALRLSVPGWGQGGRGLAFALTPFCTVAGVLPALSSPSRCEAESRIPQRGKDLSEATKLVRSGDQVTLKHCHHSAHKAAPSCKSENHTGVAAQGRHTCPWLLGKEGDVTSLSWEQPRGARVWSLPSWASNNSPGLGRTLKNFQASIFPLRNGKTQVVGHPAPSLKLLSGNETSRTNMGSSSPRRHTHSTKEGLPCGSWGGGAENSSVEE